MQIWSIKILKTLFAINVQLSLVVIYPPFKGRTVPLRENSYRYNYFLDGKQSMGNFDSPDLWEILIPQICIDFHDWENCTSTRKLLLNLFQTGKIKNYILNETLQDLL